MVPLPPSVAPLATVKRLEAEVDPFTLSVPAEMVVLPV